MLLTKSLKFNQWIQEIIVGYAQEKQKQDRWQKTISYVGPSFWNTLPDSIKKGNA